MIACYLFNYDMMLAPFHILRQEVEKLRNLVVNITFISQSYKINRERYIGVYVMQWVLIDFGTSQLKRSKYIFSTNFNHF